MRQNAANQASPGALAGIRVVDLTRILGGPYGTQILADHGAEVIKIEPPQGDDTRAWGPPFDADEASSYYLGTNRNKFGMVLDLTKTQGRQVLLRMLEEADILIENLKVGTMERWGLGYEELEKRFPRLVYCRISGFGANGPWGGMPGYDAVVQAGAGMMSVNGCPNCPPTRIGIPLVDMGTGLMSVNGVLMALLERERSGRGQMIDMALYDCAVSLLHPVAANSLLSGKVPGRTGNAHSNVSPYDKFSTKTCDLYLAVGNDRQFRALTKILGQPELASDPRFADPTSRNRNVSELTSILQEAFLAHDGEVLANTLMKLGVPAGPVLNVSEVLHHPQVRAREMVVHLDDYAGTGIPVKFSRTPGSVRHKPPRFGEHTRDVLERMGYTSEEIQGIMEDGVTPTERRGL